MKRLEGFTFVIPRTSGGSTPFSTTLEEEGATTVEFPMVTIGPPPDEEALDAAVGRIEEFHWVVFCHVSSTRTFLERLIQLRGDVEALKRASRLAAVGDQRRAAVEAYGLTVQVTPGRASPKELVKALEEEAGDLRGAAVLIVSSEPAGPVLEGLKGLGARVTHVQGAQRTINMDDHEKVAGMMEEGRVEAVVFLSPGGVAQFQKAMERYGALEAAAGGVRAYAMSARTAERAGPLGFRNVTSPPEPTREALLETLCADLKR